MGRVQRLTDELANQIAAGEVVERPASVVKELVENALDAKATRVTVDIERGGTLLVRVTDDGEGMSSEDALLAVERHATSKIRTLEDLFRIGTFGFRGEALPSIASVSELRLRTRLHDRDEGSEIAISGGKAPVVRPAGGAAGTTVEVRELFFNVPARRKFLKATGTESAHIADVVLGAALARPDVTFTFSRDGRVVKSYLRVGSRAERARATSDEPLEHVVAERGSLRIEAMLAAPERARTGASGLSILVNGRPVRDRVLARAVANAYGSVLEAGRYPSGVVWIELPHELVDINVHPQKAEVRFTDARGVFDAITRELHAGLAQAFQLSDVSQPFAQSAKASPASALPISPLLHFFDRPATLSPAPAATSTGSAALLPETNLFVAESNVANAPWSGPGIYATLRFVGQVHATFLVCEGTDGLYVIDQHAAAERVSFDRLRRAFAARTVATQRLLVPEMVELAPAQAAMLEEQLEEVGALGVEVRAVGDNAVAVHAIPAILAARAKPAEIVRNLASELSRSGGRAFGGAVDLVLATMACHGSVRAGDTVSPEEARALLSALDEVDFAGHCPHGRPIVMRLGWGELERRVGR